VALISEFQHVASDKDGVHKPVSLAGGRSTSTAERSFN